MPDKFKKGQIFVNRSEKKSGNASWIKVVNWNCQIKVFS